MYIEVTFIWVDGVSGQEHKTWDSSVSSLHSEKSWH